MSDNTDYPNSFIFGEDEGHKISGNYLHTDEGIVQRKGGREPVPILVLESKGEPRSIWALHSALRNQIREELSKRESRDFEPGELISIERGTELKEPKDPGGDPYWPYTLEFEHGAKHTAADIFGLDDKHAADDPPDRPKDEPSGPGPGDDEIPF